MRRPTCASSRTTGCARRGQWAPLVQERLIELRAGGRASASGHDHGSIREQGGGVEGARGLHGCGRGPGLRLWIVELGRGDRLAPYAQHARRIADDARLLLREPARHFIGRATAQNDGERWRWALDQVVENNPDRKSEVLMHRAQFSQNQFGEQTLQQYGYGWGRRGGGQADDKDESGTYSLHTLKDSETIAKLATGIKRLTLPDEQNYVVLYKEIAAEGKGGYEQQAIEQLAKHRSVGLG